MKIMRSFSTFLTTAAGRAMCAAIVVASLYSFSDPTTYLYALEVQQAKEAQIRGIAAKLGVNPEFLLHSEGKSSFFELKGVMAWANAKLGLTTAAATQESFANASPEILATHRRRKAASPKTMSVINFALWAGLAYAVILLIVRRLAPEPDSGASR